MPSERSIDFSSLSEGHVASLSAIFLKQSLAVHYHQLVFEEHCFVFEENSLADHCHCSTIEPKY
jgi:hypothetical protein